jgi:hypothetical protein
MLGQTALEIHLQSNQSDGFYFHMLHENFVLLEPSSSSGIVMWTFLLQSDVSFLSFLFFFFVLLP